MKGLALFINERQRGEHLPIKLGNSAPFDIRLTQRILRSNFGCDEIADQIFNMYIRPGPRHFDEIGGFFLSRRRDIRSFFNVFYMAWGWGFEKLTR